MPDIFKDSDEKGRRRIISLNLHEVNRPIVVQAITKHPNQQSPATSLAVAQDHLKAQGEQVPNNRLFRTPSLI